MIALHHTFPISVLVSPNLIDLPCKDGTPMGCINARVTILYIVLITLSGRSGVDTIRTHAEDTAGMPDPYRMAETERRACAGWWRCCITFGFTPLVLVI